MGARWYDAALGRFISPDTIVPDPKNPQNFNRYAYAASNPLKYNDPTGHTVDCGLNCRHEEDNALEPPPPQEPDEQRFDWNIMPDGVRGDGSFMVPVVGPFAIGVDANIDFVTAGFTPDQSSIIIGGEIQMGFGGGLSVNAGPIWHNVSNLEDYKTMSNGIGVTVSDDLVLGALSSEVGAIGALLGFEPSYEWSSTTDAQSVFLGVIGGGEELSAWYSKQVIQGDVFNKEITIGIEGIWEKQLIPKPSRDFN